MKITTTFWSKEKFEFSKLLYINGNTKEIMFETNLDNVFETYLFFKNIAKFVKSNEVLKTIDNSAWANQTYYQFATIFEDKITHIKWFDLVINEKMTISHDIAFQTTLIKRNNVDIPFGRFPNLYYKNNIDPKLAKYREFNIKSRAYKFMANQIKKTFKSL